MQRIKITFFTLFVVLLAILFSQPIYAQNASEKPLRFGVESEIMTWINSGYHGSFWIGKKGHRARAVFAKATYPNYLNPDGFKNLTSVFYEIETDHFFGKKKNEFRGFWFALGAGYTKQSIISERNNQKKTIDLLDVHSGIGYAISLYKDWYINPWIGIDYHINAPKEVWFDANDSNVWKPRKIDPVLGAKIGYSF